MAEPITINWRASATPGYLDCARKQFAQTHARDLKRLGYDLAEETNSVGAAMGTVGHKLAAELLKIKMNCGGLTVGDIDEALENTWNHFDETIGTGNVIWDKTTPHEQTAREQIHAIGRALVPVCQLIEPIRVEEKYEHEISPLGEQAATKILLSGTLDAYDNRYALWDHKCGARFPKGYHPQAGCYLILLQLHDEPTKGAYLNYTPRLGITKLDNTMAQTIKLDVQECIDAAWGALRDMQMHHEMWLESLAEVQAGKRDLPDLWTIPANAATQNCTPNYCNAYGTSFCKVGSDGKGGES